MPTSEFIQHFFIAYFGCFVLLKLGTWILSSSFSIVGRMLGLTSKKSNNDGEPSKRFDIPVSVTIKIGQNAYTTEDETEESDHEPDIQAEVIFDSEEETAQTEKAIGMPSREPSTQSPQPVWK